MQITVDDLYRIIGNKEVEIIQLRTLIHNMQQQQQNAAVQPEPESDRPPKPPKPPKDREQG